MKGLGTVGLVLSAGDGTGRTMIGAKGNDTIQGGAGNDTLDGGAGNDILNGGPAADTLNGALGFDVADYGLEAAGGGDRRYQWICCRVSPATGSAPTTR